MYSANFAESSALQLPWSTQQYPTARRTIHAPDQCWGYRPVFPARLSQQCSSSIEQSIKIIKPSIIYIYTSRIMCLPNHRWLRDGFLRANLNNPSQATTCGGSSETGSKSGPLRLELCVIYDPEALYSCPA